MVARFLAGAPAPAVMPPPSATSDRLAQVVHLYLAVAGTTDADREPHERQLTIDLSRRWAPSFGPGAVEAVVDTAYTASRSGMGPRVLDVAEELCRDLPESARRRLLVDLGIMARADGRLSRRQAQTIAQVRVALGTAGALQGAAS